MHGDYEDIKSRIAGEPSWHDQNGTPRYGEFIPQRCPNIYAPVVCLFKIACQDCGEEFLVEMHADIWTHRLSQPPAKWHYGDPPIHGCVGDTMNCEDLEVLEVWERMDALGDWNRRPEFEGRIDHSEAVGKG